MAREKGGAQAFFAEIVRVPDAQIGVQGGSIFSCSHLYHLVARYSMLFLQNINFLYYPPNYTKLMSLIRTGFG
jgi:hypothetical protein